jgi:hypothetical protein
MICEDQAFPVPLIIESLQYDACAGRAGDRFLLVHLGIDQPARVSVQSDLATVNIGPPIKLARVRNYKGRVLAD